MRWTKAALWPEPMALDAPVSKAEDAPSLGELLPGAGPSPEMAAIEADRAEYAHRLVATLPVRERSVIVLRFALVAPHRSWTLGQIASLCEVSRERIRQIERAALERLRGELPARQVPALARTWAPPSSPSDRLGALEDVLLRDDLDPADRRRFISERNVLRARVAS